VVVGVRHERWGYDVGGEVFHLFARVEERGEQDEVGACVCDLAQALGAGVGRPADGGRFETLAEVAVELD
jgi:hypothetical protein